MRSESVVRLREIDFQTGPDDEGSGEGAEMMTAATRGVEEEGAVVAGAVVVVGGGGGGGGVGGAVVAVAFVSVKISTLFEENSPVKKSFVGDAVPVVSAEPSVAVLQTPVRILKISATRISAP